MGGKISISQMYITEYENIRKDSQLYENIQKNILSGEVYFIIPDNYEWLNYDIGINTIRLLLMDNVNDYFILFYFIGLKLDFTISFPMPA